MAFYVPPKTHVNKTEFTQEYVISFAPELVDFILQNLKTTTYRLGNKYDYLQVGDEIQVHNTATDAVVGTAKVSKKSQIRFKDLPLTNGTHESYKDKEHQRQVLSGYYAFIGRPIADDDEFLAFDFELTGRSAKS